MVEVLSAPGSVLILDIGLLVTMAGPCGQGEKSLGLCPQGKVVLSSGKVLYAGPAEGGPRAHEIPGPVRIVSALGGLCTPGLCDPHTHGVYAGSRAKEFDLRNQGVSYGEIQRQGGGIHSTVQATTSASTETLLALTRKRFARMRSLGTTTYESKTGYGLVANEELRHLELLCGLASEEERGRLSPTLLFHVPPSGLSQAARQSRLEELCALVPKAKERGALAVDVYCDQGAFTLEETQQLLRAAKAAGLFLRCHAEQFTYTGVAELAARLGAISVEHLEQVSDAGIIALRESGTVANLLPGAALTLRLPWPDARKLIDLGVKVALGTDHNPGSSLTDSLPLMMFFACTQMGLSCAEAWEAVTLNAARAIGPLGQKDPPRGQLVPGARGDVVLWETDDYREVCQYAGGSLVRQVFAAPV